jgi:hypothetical protein
VLTLDAGLLTAQVTQDIRTHDGDYLGLVKAVLDDWIGEDVFSP